MKRRNGVKKMSMFSKLSGWYELKGRNPGYDLAGAVDAMERARYDLVV